MSESSEWSDLSVSELKDYLRERGMPVSGRKKELVRRLEENSDIGAKVGKTPFGEIDSVRKNLAGVLEEVIDLGRLPVVTFSAGGIATPSDAALMMSHGMDGVFVGSGIFKSSDPARTAEAIVLATHHFEDPQVVAEASEMVGDAMPGLEIDSLEVRLDERGW